MLQVKSPIIATTATKLSRKYQISSAMSVYTLEKNLIAVNWLVLYYISSISRSYPEETCLNIK